MDGLTLSFAPPTHWTVSPIGRPPPKHPATRFWAHYDLSNCVCTGAVLVHSGEAVVGFFRFQQKPSSNVCFAYGTWVLPCLRRQHLASRMWEHMAQNREISGIHVSAGSRSGYGLVRKMSKSLGTNVYYSKMF